MMLRDMRRSLAHRRVACPVLVSSAMTLATAMTKMRRTFHVALLLVAVAAAIVGGCAPANRPPPSWSGSAGTYEPVYYDGYVVYFDRAGRPYHYDDADAVVWIPTVSPFYPTLSDYWARHRVAYDNWYEQYGYRYRSYRVVRDQGRYKDPNTSGGFW
jgi:hypothetical protein